MAVTFYDQITFGKQHQCDMSYNGKNTKAQFSKVTTADLLSNSKVWSNHQYI